MMIRGLLKPPFCWPQGKFGNAPFIAIFTASINALQHKNWSIKTNSSKHRVFLNMLIWNFRKSKILTKCLLHTVRNTSMNPSFFGKNILLIFSKIFELEISPRPIPIFASSFQGLSDEQVKFLLRTTQQLTLDKTWFWAICLTYNKTFLSLRDF